MMSSVWLQLDQSGSENIGKMRMTVEHTIQNNRSPNTLSQVSGFPPFTRQGWTYIFEYEFGFGSKFLLLQKFLL